MKKVAIVLVCLVVAFVEASNTDPFAGLLEHAKKVGFFDLPKVKPLQEKVKQDLESNDVKALVQDSKQVKQTVCDSNSGKHCEVAKDIEQRSVKLQDNQSQVKKESNEDQPTAQKAYEKGKEDGTKEYFMVADAGSGGTRITIFYANKGNPLPLYLWYNDGTKRLDPQCNGPDDIVSDLAPKPDPEDAKLVNGMKKTAFGLIDKDDPVQMNKQVEGVLKISYKRCVQRLSEVSSDQYTNVIYDKADAAKKAEIDVIPFYKNVKSWSEQLRQAYAEGLVKAMSKQFLATAGQRLSDNLDMKKTTDFYDAVKSKSQAICNAEYIKFDGYKISETPGPTAAKTMSGVWEGMLGFFSSFKKCNAVTSKNEETVKFVQDDPKAMLYMEAGGASLQVSFAVGSNANFKTPALLQVNEQSSLRTTAEGYFSQAYPRTGFSNGQCKKESAKSGSAVRLYSHSWLGNGFSRLMVGSVFQVLKDAQFTYQKKSTVENPCLFKGLKLQSTATDGAYDQGEKKKMPYCWDGSQDKPSEAKFARFDRKVCEDLGGAQGQNIAPGMHKVLFDDFFVTQEGTMVGTGNSEKCKAQMRKYMYEELDETNAPVAGIRDSMLFKGQIYQKSSPAVARGSVYFGTQLANLKNALQPRYSHLKYVIVNSATMNGLLAPKKKHYRQGEHKTTAFCGDQSENQCVAKDKLKEFFTYDPASVENIDFTKLLDKDTNFWYNLPMAQAYFWLLMEELNLMNLPFCPVGADWAAGFAWLQAQRKCDGEEDPKVRDYTPDIEHNEWPDDVDDKLESTFDYVHPLPPSFLAVQSKLKRHNRHHPLRRILFAAQQR